MTTNPRGNDRRRTYGCRHRSSTGNASPGSSLHGEERKTRQPGAHYAASGRLHERDTLCALALFEGAIEGFDIAMAGHFGTQVLNGMEVLSGLRTSQGWRVEQQPYRIAETLQVVVFEKL